MRKRLFWALLVLSLLAAACGQKPNPKPPKAKPSPTPTESPSEAPSPAVPVLCPLTGTPAPEGIDVNRPALAVKIDNHPDARPQSGLESADIVYEELVEGGLTRFMAVTHCQNVARLGPVRSARLVDPDLLVQYQPVLFGYSGAAPQVLTKVQSTAGVINLVHGSNGGAYTRQRVHVAPHNLYTTSDALRGVKAAQGVQGPPRTGLLFDAAPPAGGTPGNSVSFTYSPGNGVSYAYDAASQKYLRSMNGVPHKLESGAQVSASNVVVQKVGVVIVAGSAHITVTGEGEVTVLRNGQAFAGKWVRPSLGDEMTLVDASGQPIKLAPGNTWINLLPSDRPVTVQ